MESTSLIPVRYAETDRMGVIHHSHYPVYFEQGRSDFFIEHLEPYSHFEEAGILAPVLELQLQILGRATYGDVLNVLTRADWMKGLRLQMSYEVSVGSRAVARGSTLHALVDRELRPAHPRHFGSLFASLRKVFPAPE